MNVSAGNLLEYGIEIFTKIGVSENEARIVMEELVKANLYGVDSHGVIRIPEYMDGIKAGAIKSDAPTTVVKETATTIVIDGNHNFGQITARELVNKLAQKAKTSNIACGITLHTNHIGRLGSYTEALAQKGFLAFAVAAVYQSGPMAPFGGIEGRMGTNPMSWAAPRKNDRPIVMDFATTVVAEGKLRHYIQQGKSVPSGWIKDGYGNDTTDPHDFYKEPQGTIYPIGGVAGSVKGSALGIMVDIFSVALANTDYWTCLEKGEPLEAENGLFIVAINPEAFFGLDAFAAQCGNHSNFIKSAKKAPNVKEILMPGEFEYKTEADRLANGIDLPEATWEGLVEIAQNLDCDWSRNLPKPKTKTNFVKY